MSDYLPKDVRDGLAAARRQSLRKLSRLTAQDGSVRVLVLRHWSNGFTVDAEDGPRLRGLVDLYEGPNLMFQCLIVAAVEEQGEWVYEFKRSTPAADSAPLDFERSPDAPVALIGKGPTVH